MARNVYFPYEFEANKNLFDKQIHGPCCISTKTLNVFNNIGCYSNGIQLRSELIESA